MPIVTFVPSAKRVEVTQGTTLLIAATHAGLPVASSCSADSVCGKCNMQVLEGAENLSEPSNYEKSLLLREKNPDTDRISCLARVFGDCKVTTRYW